MADIVPYHDRDGFIWLDGQLIPWRDAKVHVLTHALHYAAPSSRVNAPTRAKFSSCVSTPSA